MKMQPIHKSKKLIGMLVICMVLTCFPTVKPLASTISPEQQFRQLYLNLLETGDTSVQDISSLNLPYMTCYNIMEDVKKNEGFVAYQSYNQYNLIQVDAMETRDDVPYLLQFHMTHADTNFQQRYQTVQNLVSTVRGNIDSKMTDLDKLLYFHEYVVANIYYNNTNTDNVHLGGATLTQGYGVCEGYTYALMLFLRSENISCEEVAGGAHSWLAVKLDGEWYLVDPTWDDTRSASYGTHYFFVRNDDEFYNTLTAKHEVGQLGSTILDQVSGTISTSTKYTDWYVHNVWGQMYYYDGYWYYTMNNSIRKNNIQGTDESILYEGTNLSITGITGNVLNFSSNGEAKQLELIQSITPTDPATPSDPTDSGNTTNPSSPTGTGSSAITGTVTNQGSSSVTGTVTNQGSSSNGSSNASSSTSGSGSSTTSSSKTGSGTSTTSSGKTGSGNAATLASTAGTGTSTASNSTGSSTVNAQAANSKTATAKKGKKKKHDFSNNDTDSTDHKMKVD